MVKELVIKVSSFNQQSLKPQVKTTQLSRKKSLVLLRLLVNLLLLTEAIKKANDSEYGLASGVHTNDLHVALEVSNRLQAGTVWVNTYNDLQESTPFGGYKQSGFGREMGIEVFDNYTQVKAVRMKYHHKTALSEGKK